MPSRKEELLIKQAILRISKDLNRSYKRLLLQTEDILEEFYSNSSGYVDAQNIMNGLLSETYEFTQIKKYAEFYESAYVQAIVEANSLYKLQYNFSQVDTKALAQFSSVQNWFTSKYQTLTDQTATINQIKELWSSGESVEDAVKSLGDIFGKSNKRALAHVRNNIITNNTRVRSTADLNNFQQNRVKEYIFNAVIDNVTTDTCRSLNGKRYSVEKAVEFQKKIDAKMTEILSKDNPDWKLYNESMKYLQNNDSFATYNKNTDRWESRYIERASNPEKQGKEKVRSYKKLSDVAGNHIPRPPLHHFCRSRVDPVL